MMIASSKLRQPESFVVDGKSKIMEPVYWSLVVAVNNERVLKNTLLGSPAIDGRCQVITERGFASAGKAYNAGIEEARHDIIVFAHQDVYLPEDWTSSLARALAQLAVDDPNWGVLGSFGVVKGKRKDRTGYCYSTGLKAILGEPFSKPIQTLSLDELLLVLRRSSGLRFDENMPGFHLYGTDICLQADSRNMNSYIISAFCVHNSNGVKRFPLDFWRSYFYLRKKWWHRLPITTCCTTITKLCLPVGVRLAEDLRQKLSSCQVGTRCEHVEELYRKLQAANFYESQRQLRIAILGATFETQNMGVSALTAGTIKCILSQHPYAVISLLDYAKKPSAYMLRLQGRNVSVPLVNMRFSKKFYQPNNIAFLLLLAVLSKLMPIRKVGERLLARNECLRHIAEATLIASIAGGDSFSDTYGLTRLLYVGLPQVLVLILGKPLLLLPQTVGPFRGRFSRTIARYILQHAFRVYTRDYRSLKEVEALFRSSLNQDKYEFCYDVGFVLDPIEPSRHEVVGLTIDKPRRSPLVGVNISGLLFKGGYTRNNAFGLRSSYKDLVYSLIDLLISKKGADVLIVPHVFGSQPDSESDSVVCEQVFAALEEKYEGRLGLLRGTYNQSEIKYLIGQCDFFVGARMHACIAAVSQHVPALSVAYSDKFAGVMETIGIESMVADARRLSVEEILRGVEESYERRAITRQMLERRIPQVKAAVLNLFGDVPVETERFLSVEIADAPSSVAVRD